VVSKDPRIGIETFILTAHLLKWEAEKLVEFLSVVANLNLM
jgi:hypothetical protein